LEISRNAAAERFPNSAALFHSLQVRAFRCIHSDLFSGVDERGHMYYQPSFERRRLHDGRRSRTLEPRLGLHNFHIDGLGQFYADRSPVIKLHVNVEIGRQVINRIAQDVLGQVRLLVTLGVHKVVVITVIVEILHLHFVHIDLFQRVGGTETVLEHGAGPYIPQLGLNEGTQVARGTVRNAKNRVQIVVVLDNHARTQLGCWYCHAGKPSPCLKIEAAVSVQPRRSH